jgi:hypothetical protein
MRFGLILGLTLGVSCVSSTALAQHDPDSGLFESEGTCAYCAESPFNWRFYDGWGTYYYYNVRQNVPAVFYYVPSVYITNNQGGCSFSPYLRNGVNDYVVDYSDEGFHTGVLNQPDDQWCDYPDIDFQAYNYIPSTGVSFARLMYKLTNTDAAQQTINLQFSGYPIYSNRNVNPTVVGTGDGDGTIEAADRWFVIDDEEDSGMPVVGVVWAAEGADEQADSITVTMNQWGAGEANMDLRFNGITIDAGETKTVGIFLIQSEDRTQALADAEDVADMGGQASDFLDIGEVENSLVNFIPGDPTGPRLRSNGPYTCDEGGSTQLNIIVEDRDGEGSVTYDWDPQNDGTFGEYANTNNPIIDCTNNDGNSTIRWGIRLTDDEGIVEDRSVSIAVRNVAPVVTSTPPATATTNQEYQYQITVDDIPADTFTYEIDEGPAGMTVSGSGLVRWTAPANGIGPDVPVQINVLDDDGGEAEHTWMISMRGGPVVNPGGPYRVAEGDEINLAITAEDPEGEAVTFAWDLDADGVFDDSSEPNVVWSAAGIDGPAEGFVVHVVVSDGDYDIQASIPIEVTNAPPIFGSVPSPIATIDREWVYVVQAVDPGDDPFEITVDEDEMPLGMVFDPITATFRWTPNEGHLLTGEPPGHYCFTITAEDEDRGRGRQEACTTISRNTAPPVPPIKYPDGTEPVRTAQPTIILDNVDDADGDAVQYFVQVDSNPCFCSAELQESGAMNEGQLVTQYALPRPFNVDISAGGHTTFYVQRWSYDGLDESAKELSLFEYEPPVDGGDGDADADADVDADVDADDDDTTEKPRSECACRTPGLGTRTDVSGFVLGGLLLGLMAIRRRP